MTLAMASGKALSTTRYPCAGRKRVDLPLVLLHGWGNDSRVWAEVLPLLTQQLDVITLDLPGFGGSSGCDTWQNAVELIAASLPEKCYLLGWSLGGMLAVRVTAACPKRVEKLITLAANASFIKRDGWQAAMDKTVFLAFAAGFDDDPEGCLKQFAGLQSWGDSNERLLLRWFRSNSSGGDSNACGDNSNPNGYDCGNWRKALAWLGELDNREVLAALKTPSLHIFGERDQLVPVAAAEDMRALCPGAKTEVMEGLAHAPQLSAPQALAKTAMDFMADDPYALRKAEIASSFSRAAASYDTAAHLQRQIGERLLGRICSQHVPPEQTSQQNIYPQQQPATIVDVGCGTGHFTRLLARRYPRAACTGLDLAPGMVSYARANSRENIQWLCGDAEAMPLADGSFDLVFSNFTYQWCQNLNALMAEQFRLLAPGGQLVFTTVGPRSLGELRAAWQAVDSYVHVNQFAPLEQVRSALTGAGFDIRHWQVEQVVCHYAQLNDLTRELKALGAHNVNRGRNSALTGRKHIEKLKAAYETCRQAQGLPASWEILYVVAERSTQV